MSIWAYLAIAMVEMELDAMASNFRGLRYRIFPSAILSLLWPITIPMTIYAITKIQSEKGHGE